MLVMFLIFSKINICHFNLINILRLSSFGLYEEHLACNILICFKAVMRSEHRVLRVSHTWFESCLYQLLPGN